MDRHDARPHRPSLLSSPGPSPATASASGRILANLENRAEPRDASRARMRLPIWSVIALAAFAIAFGGYWMSRDAVPPAASSPTGAETARDFAEVDETTAATAMIVDATPQNATPFSPGEAVRTAADARTLSPLEPPVPVPVRAAARSAKPPAGAREGARARPVAPAPVENGELLATLLRNIEQPAGATVRGAATSPMDDFVRQLRTESARKPGGAADQVQAMLRQCPKANTAQGLACRQKVCAGVAGRDPACPALQ